MRHFKKLLITGGAGFLGSNFIRFLLGDSGFSGQIINVDKLTYAGNLINIQDLERNYSSQYIFKNADICNFDEMSRIFENENVDSVCHLADESYVERSIAGPEKFMRTKIVGLENLLELARKHSKQVTQFHHSATKSASDHLARHYHIAYGVPITISNCFNNYGPFQFPKKLPPLAIFNGIEENPIPVFGDGLDVRNWVHVKDQCRAIWTIMRSGKSGEAYAIGGKNPIANIDLVRRVCSLLDELSPLSNGKPRENMITYVKDRPRNDRGYVIDSHMIQKTLGWNPNISFTEGLKDTIKWYLDNPEWIEEIKNGECQNWTGDHYG